MKETVQHHDSRLSKRTALVLGGINLLSLPVLFLVQSASESSWDRVLMLAGYYLRWTFLESYGLLAVPVLLVCLLLNWVAVRRRSLIGLLLVLILCSGVSWVYLIFGILFGFSSH